MRDPVTPVVLGERCNAGFDEEKQGFFELREIAFAGPGVL